MQPAMTTPPARFDAREASKWFFRHGHTGGKVTVMEPKASPDFPFTLDLRMMPDKV